MKKVFTLFAAALLGFCAFAQDTEPCPSKLDFVPVAAEQASNNVQIELTLLYNNSANLNGFNMEASKTGGQWVNLGNVIIPSYFVATDYAANILANLGLSQADAAQYLSQLCDVMSNVKDDTGNLVMIEVLKTNTCRFFPAVVEGSPIAIGKFAIDLSAEEDGDYTIRAEATPQGCSFSFTGGPEGNRAWTADEPIILELTKTGDIVTVKSTTPVVEPVTITGSVVDKDNTPIEGVTVTLNEVTREAITTTTDENGAYSLQYTPEEGKTYNVTFAKDGYTPQTYDATQVPATVTLESVNTGISTIGADNANGRIYDLQGRELKSVPEHGIYIQNGKKHVK